MSVWNHLQFITKFWTEKKVDVLGVWISGIPVMLPFRHWGVEILLLLLCWDFQRFRLSFQVCFSWQTILLLFFFLSCFSSFSETIQSWKSSIVFQKLFSRLAKFEVLFLFIGIFRFQGKEINSNYLNLWKFILRIFKSLRHSPSLLNLHIIQNTIVTLGGQHVRIQQHLWESAP